MRPRVLVAVLLVSGCSAPALKNISVGDYGDASTGESSGTSGETSSSGGDESSGEGSSGGSDTDTAGSGSDGTTMSTTAGEDSSSGSSSSSTTTGVGSTSTSGVEPFCGDGVVEGEEECDDGNVDEDDGCNLVCGRDRIVFVTDEWFQPFQLGGADSADDICKQVAGLAGLPNWQSYTAWLSDSTSDAIDRVHHGRGRYVRPDGVAIAANFTKLLIGPLQQPIDVTEYGEKTFGGTWTGTQADGRLVPGQSHCQDWTVNGPAEFTTRGSLMGTDGRWTHMPNPEACGGSFHLYCFEGK